MFLSYLSERVDKFNLPFPSTSNQVDGDPRHSNLWSPRVMWRHWETVRRELPPLNQLGANVVGAAAEWEQQSRPGGHWIRNLPFQWPNTVFDQSELWLVFYFNFSSEKRVWYCANDWLIISYPMEKQDTILCGRVHYHHVDPCQVCQNLKNQIDLLYQMAQVVSCTRVLLLHFLSRAECTPRKCIVDIMSVVEICWEKFCMSYTLID